MDRTDPRAGGVYIHTLGCPKNDADSRSLSRVLAAAGIPIVVEPEESGRVIINTCGFIQDAKEESIGAILEACETYGGDRVVVTGCLVERYRGELEAGIPEVAAWFGLGDIGGMTEFLRSGASDAPGGASLDRPGSSYAYVKISDGCDEACAFCAIPGIKGPYYSVAVDEILAEAGRCLDEGARELVLVGQDTAIWRDGGLGLTDLVDRIAADPRVARIRLMYLQPEHVDDGLLQFMAAHPKLCRYLDIPFQHAHPRILQRMCRVGDATRYLDLLERARKAMPDVSVRTTFIVGFPGEREEEFEALLAFASAAGFDHAGGFVYSPEEGTPAADLRPRVGRRVATERLARLTDLLASVAEGRHERLVGSDVEVMIDSLDAAELEEGFSAIGRTAGQAPEVDGVTHVEGDLPDDLGPGDILTVKVTEVMGYDLVGRYEPA